jgi:hypothetical protein
LGELALNDGLEPNPVIEGTTADDAYGELQRTTPVLDHQRVSGRALAKRKEKDG